MSSSSFKVIKKVQKTFTVDTAGSFLTNESLHDDAIKLENCLQDKGSGKLIGIVITDLDAVNRAMAIDLFSTAIPNTTVTASSTINVDDADLLSLQAHIEVASAEYVNYQSNSQATKELNLPIDLGKGNRDLWVTLRAKGAHAAYGTANAITIKFFFEQD